MILTKFRTVAVTLFMAMLTLPFGIQAEAAALENEVVRWMPSDLAESQFEAEGGSDFAREAIVLFPNGEGLLSRDMVDQKNCGLSYSFPVEWSIRKDGSLEVSSRISFGSCNKGGGKTTIRDVWVLNRTEGNRYYATLNDSESIQLERRPFDEPGICNVCGFHVNFDGQNYLDGYVKVYRDVGGNLSFGVCGCTNRSQGDPGNTCKVDVKVENFTSCPNGRYSYIIKVVRTETVLLKTQTSQSVYKFVEGVYR
jgi:hypothetical protein